MLLINEKATMHSASTMKEPVMMEVIANEKFVSSEACEQMIQVLLEQKFKEKIPAQLPESAKVAHKTGSITKIDHDCAIVYPPNFSPYILVILTKGMEEQKQAMKLIAEISKMIFDFHTITAI